MARDAAAAVSFMERAAEVEPPPELMTRLLFEAPWAQARTSASGRVTGSGAFCIRFCSPGSRWEWR